MVTIKEIAKRCNVSIATVSNIINGKPNVGRETREKVLKTIEELNYTPNYIAKNLKTRRSKTIGVVVEDITAFCAPNIVDGITKCCEEMGYHILLTNLRLYRKFGESYYENEKFFPMIQKEIKELIAKQVDGIVYVTTHERVLKCLPEELNVPAVMAYGYTRSPKYPSIVVDDRKGAAEVIRYLFSMGHRRIGTVSGPVRSIHTRERLLGVQDIFTEQGIPFEKKCVVEGDWRRGSGYRGTDSLLEQKVTAIFCMSDIMAGGVYDRLGELGLIPGKDISVAGFDDRELSTYYKPPLTTTALPLFEIGYTACELAIRKIEGSDCGEEPEELLEIARSCSLTVRDSVKDIRIR